MTRLGIISQARMTSTRLPGKVLMEAGGKTMLAHHIERLRTSGLPVYVATTTNVTDDSIEAEANRLGVAGVYRGDEHDVLGRYAEAVRLFDLDVVVRVTSDCPLIDGQLVRRGVDQYLSLDDPRAYVSNVMVRTYPRGFDFEVFSALLLQEAAAKARSASEREHVTPYMYATARGDVTQHHVTSDRDTSRYRVTLDTVEDLSLIRELLTQDPDLSGVSDIVQILDESPELVALNAAVLQKES